MVEGLDWRLNGSDANHLPKVIGVNDRLGFDRIHFRHELLVLRIVALNLLRSIILVCRIDYSAIPPSPVSSLLASKVRTRFLVEDMHGDQHQLQGGLTFHTRHDATAARNG